MNRLPMRQRQERELGGGGEEIGRQRVGLQGEGTEKKKDGRVSTVHMANSQRERGIDQERKRHNCLFFDKSEPDSLT